MTSDKFVLILYPYFHSTRLIIIFSPRGHRLTPSAPAQTFHLNFYKVRHVFSAPNRTLNTTRRRRLLVIVITPFDNSTNCNHGRPQTISI